LELEVGGVEPPSRGLWNPGSTCLACPLMDKGGTGTFLYPSLFSVRGGGRKKGNSLHLCPLYEALSGRRTHTLKNRCL